MATINKKNNLYSFLKNNIRGIGELGIKNSIARLGLLPNFKVRYMEQESLDKILDFVLNKLELKKFKNENYFIKSSSLNKLKTLNSYRSNRHNNNMPVRGQRTHTNSKTRRKHNVK